MPTEQEILARLNGQTQQAAQSAEQQILDRLNGVQSSPIVPERYSSIHTETPREEAQTYSPNDLRYLDTLSFSEKASKAWNSGWGSVKSSFGAGLQWVGIENDIKALEEYGRELQKRGMDQVIDNYVPMKDFEWGDLLTENFWSVKAPTIIPSMISLMGPAVVAGVGGTVATEAALGGLWPAALAEPTPYGEIALGLAGGVGGLVAASTTSRALEGVMEAGGAWSEIVDKLVEQGMSVEEAQKIAGAQAANVYKKNWALAGMDAMEFAIALSPLKGLGAGMRSAKMGAKIAKRLGRNSKMPAGFKKVGETSCEVNYEYCRNSQAHYFCSSKRREGYCSSGYSSWNGRI